jgi:DNA primase
MTAKIEEIKQDLDMLQLLGLTGEKPAALTNGGEYKIPCPWCGGDDRCNIWPNHPKGARGWCRKCDKQFDVLDLFAHLQNMTISQAIHSIPSYTVPVAKSLSNEKAPEIDRNQWQNRSREFVLDCMARIFDKEGETAIQWLLQRGISADSVKKFELGYNPVDKWESAAEWGIPGTKKIWLPRGIVIPQPFGKYVKIRRPVTGNDPKKYILIQGSIGAMYPAGNFSNKTIGYLFESELDAILASQSGYQAAYLSLPAGQSLTGHIEYLKDIEDLIICMDWDQAGIDAAKKHLQYTGTIESDPLPGGAKDLGQYYTRSSMDQVTEWLLDQAEKIEGKAWT